MGNRSKSKVHFYHAKNRNMKNRIGSLVLCQLFYFKPDSTKKHTAKCTDNLLKANGTEGIDPTGDETGISPVSTPFPSSTASHSKDSNSHSPR